jgi:A/G-specific adenine glycosylase
MNIKLSVSPTRAKVKRGVTAKKKLPAVKANPRKASPYSGYSIALLAWYDRHRRLLPWRALPGVAPDPYRIWLSEIMLQQTTVAAVGPYFQRFTARWPTLDDLAAAPIDDIMTMWAGLGYYRRARMLHACAQHVHKHFHGHFPTSVEALLELPGFGPYTAAAVGAIAFDQPANVVDGNVERVIARIFAIPTPLPAAKPDIRAAAAKLLPSSRPGDYAQALMDLGATICTPRNPKCMLCPWHSFCKARKQGIAEALPRRIKAKAKPVRRAIAFVLTNADGDIFLRPRPPEGLLGGMLEVPSSPWIQDMMPSLTLAKSQAPVPGVKWRLMPGMVTHVFTHFVLELSVATGRTTRKVAPPTGLWVALDRLDKVALPSVMHKVVRQVYKNVT